MLYPRGKRRQAWTNVESGKGGAGEARVGPLGSDGHLFQGSLACTTPGVYPCPLTNIHKRRWGGEARRWGWGKCREAQGYNPGVGSLLQP